MINISGRCEICHFKVLQNLFPQHLMIEIAKQTNKKTQMSNKKKKKCVYCNSFPNELHPNATVLKDFGLQELKQEVRQT